MRGGVTLVHPVARASTFLADQNGLESNPMIKDDDAVRGDTPKRTSRGITTKHYLIFSLSISVGLSLYYFAINSFPAPYITFAVILLFVLGIGIRGTVRSAVLPQPDTSFHSADKDARRWAVIAATSLTCGAVFPVVLFSLVADWSYLGASLRGGEYLGWLERIVISALIVFAPAYFVLIRIIRKSTKGRTNHQ